MPRYGTFGQRVKAKAKKIAGLDDDSVPRSISVKEYFQENNGDFRQGVSDQQPSLGQLARLSLLVADS
jgi:hypothetical protein